VQVLFLIAIFTTLASAILHDNPNAALRASLTPALSVLCLSIFLVAIYSGGIRSRPAHAHLRHNLHSNPSAARRPPDSIVSHAISYEDIIASLRAELGRRSTTELLEEASIHRTYEVDAFNSGDLGDGTDARDSLAEQPLLQQQDEIEEVLQGDTFSRRSSSSIASDLYHEQPAADVKPMDVLHTSEFYLLVFCCFVTMGAALSVLDNLEQLIGSLAPRKSGKGTPTETVILEKHHELGQALLICFSICNTFGRILAGYFSEHALRIRV
jgi:hypothetical protein